VAKVVSKVEIGLNLLPDLIEDGWVLPKALYQLVRIVQTVIVLSRVRMVHVLTELKAVFLD